MHQPASLAIHILTVSPTSKDEDFSSSRLSHTRRLKLPPDSQIQLKLRDIKLVFLDDANLAPSGFLAHSVYAAAVS